MSARPPKKSPLRKRGKLEREASTAQLGKTFAGAAIAFMGLVLLAGIALVARTGGDDAEAELAAEREAERPPEVEPPKPDPEAAELAFIGDPEEDVEVWRPPPQELWREQYREAYALAGKERFADAVVILDAILPDVKKGTAGRREVESLLRYACQVGVDRAREGGDAATAERLMARSLDLPSANPGEKATNLYRLALAAFGRRDLAIAGDRVVDSLQIEPDRIDAQALVDEIAAEQVGAGEGADARELLERVRALIPDRRHPSVVIAGAWVRLGRFEDARAELRSAEAAHAGDAELVAEIADVREWLLDIEVRQREAEAAAKAEAELAAARGLDEEPAEPEDDGTDWEGARRYSTKRFAIKSNLPRWLARWAGDQMDDGFLRLLHVLGVRPPMRKASVLLFREHREYIEFCDREAPGFRNSGGFYDGGRRRIVLFARADLDREHLLEGLLHEEAHYGMHVAMPRVGRPKWLEEGLAQYFAAALFHDKRSLKALRRETRKGRKDEELDTDAFPKPPRMRLCRNRRFQARLLAARAASGERRTLREVIATDRDAYTGADMNAVYAEAFSLTRFLILAEDDERAGAPRLVPTADGIVAFLRGTTVDQLATAEIEAAWRAWEEKHN